MAYEGWGRGGHVVTLSPKSAPRLCGLLVALSKALQHKQLLIYAIDATRHSRAAFFAFFAFFLAFLSSGVSSRFFFFFPAPAPQRSQPALTSAGTGIT